MAETVQTKLEALSVDDVSQEFTGIVHGATVSKVSPYDFPESDKFTPGGARTKLDARASGIRPKCASSSTLTTVRGERRRWSAATLHL